MKSNLFSNTWKKRLTVFTLSFSMVLGLTPAFATKARAATDTSTDAINEIRQQSADNDDTFAPEEGHSLRIPDQSRQPSTFVMLTKTGQKQIISHRSANRIPTVPAGDSELLPLQKAAIPPNSIGDWLRTRTIPCLMIII